MPVRSVVNVLVLAFVAYLGLAVALPPVDDELYYWCWSKQLQWSYYDHPGMTAWMIGLSTTLFGDQLWAIRLPACICMTGVLAVLFALTKPRSILWGLAASPIFTLGAVIITPDTPLLFFWALYLYWLVQVHRRIEQGIPLWLWSIGGVVLGCGILGKYTCGLAIPAGMVSLIVTRIVGSHLAPRDGISDISRSEMTTNKSVIIGYLLHLAIAFLTTFPILVHNIKHDFQPLLFQWQHAMVDSEPGLQPLGEFVGIQILLFGTLPWIMLPWVAWRFRDLIANPTLRVCICLTYLPLIFFTLKSTRGALQANWALVSFLGFWPIAAYWCQAMANSRFWVWGTRLTFAIPAACVLLLASHLMFTFPWIPCDKDRVSRFRARDNYARQVAEKIKQRGDGKPVFVSCYQWVAFLRFHGVDARQFAGMSRPSHFTQRPESPADYPESWFFSDFAMPGEFANGIKCIEHVETLEFRMRGQKLVDYCLYSCEGTRDVRPKPPIQVVNANR